MRRSFPRSPKAMPRKRRYEQLTNETKGLEMTYANGARKAKIVCTIGPASGSEAVLRDLMRAGHGRGPAEFLPRHA